MAKQETDIVQRLRGNRDPLRCFGSMEEAADEIERLRAAVAKQGEEINRICELSLADKTEIERLRAEIVVNATVNAPARKDIGLCGA